MERIDQRLNANMVADCGHLLVKVVKRAYILHSERKRVRYRPPYLMVGDSLNKINFIETGILRVT